MENHNIITISLNIFHIIILYKMITTHQRYNRELKKNISVVFELFKTQHHAVFVFHLPAKK